MLVRSLQALLSRGDFGRGRRTLLLQLLQRREVAGRLLLLRLCAFKVAGQGETLFLRPIVLRSVEADLRGTDRHSRTGQPRPDVRIVHRHQQRAGWDLVAYLDIQPLHHSGKRSVSLDIRGSALPCRWPE